MMRILARPVQNGPGTPKNVLAWYGQALKQGFGIAIPMPQNEAECNRISGLFVEFLNKRLEKDTFLAIMCGDLPQASVPRFVHEMVGLFPQSAMLSNPGSWFEVTEKDLREKERQELLCAVITQARARGYKVTIAYTAGLQSEKEFVDAVLYLAALGPDFFVTDKPHAVLKIVIPFKHEPIVRKLLRAPVVWYIRGRIGRLRFVLREYPRYWLVYVLENLTGRLISLHTRPLYAHNYTAQSDELVVVPHVAIMLQGPLMHKRNFTLETIKLYRKIFPHADIILSTWENEDPKTLEHARTLGAIVVLNKKPGYAGSGNTNMQLVSAFGGVKRASELGASYTLKQRTDQRIYNYRAIEMLVNLARLFPPSERSHQRARLIFGTGSTVYQPYQMGEVVFGDTADVLDYCSAPLLMPEQTWERYLVEIYIPSEFLKKKGWNLEWTIEHGWQVYRDCFLALDWSMLDLYWYKYFQHRYWEYQNQRPYFNSLPSPAIVRFDEWVNIFVNYENKRLRPEQKPILPLLPRTEHVD